MTNPFKVGDKVVVVETDGCNLLPLDTPLIVRHVEGAFVAVGYEDKPDETIGYTPSNVSTNGWYAYRFNKVEDVVPAPIDYTVRTTDTTSVMAFNVVLTHEQISDIVKIAYKL